LVLTSAYTFKRNEGGNMRNDLPEQAPVMTFFSRPIPNSHQVIDSVNSIKSTIDVYSAYNNERTRLNFGILYNVIKNRWANIASHWNADKVFNIVGHFAAAKQNYIIVNATEIDYEDISKSSNTSSNLPNTASSDPQAGIINRFYDSLNLQQSSSTTTTHSANSDQVTSENTTSSPGVSISSLPQQIISNPITSDSSVSLTPTSQSSNQIYGQYSQYYHPTNSTNLPNSNNSIHLPYPYFNPTHPMHHQFTPNLQQIPNTSNDPDLSQSTPPLNNNNSIVIEEISPTQAKNPPQKRRKRATPKKKENPTNSKKVKTRSDTKLNQNSGQGVMGLAVTSLLENSKMDDSENSSNSMEIDNMP